jgi:peptidylprolyl isomerase
MLLSFLLTGQTAGRKYPDGLYAEIMTNKGLIVCQLEFEKTPMTVANFVGLAEGTIKNTALPEGVFYFDGTKFHRVVAGHVIQAGIPEGGKTQGPGYQFPNEIRLPELSHGRAGMLNMANGGPHTNGSQWCITLGDRSYLDGDYTVWGHVIQGMDVVMSIVQGDVVQSVKIVRVGRAAEGFRPTTDTFLRMVEAAKVRVKQDEERRRAEEERLIEANWPGAMPGENGVKYAIVRPGEGDAPAPGDRMKVAYSGKTLGGAGFVSTAGGGKPYFGDKPEPFDFEAGRAQVQVNPGFDAQVSKMKKGEKRTLIVPPAQAYGTAGYYDPFVQSQRRFHISPNTTLVYEVEILDLARK